jgi:hypothetical protein
MGKSGLSLTVVQGLQLQSRDPSLDDWQSRESIEARPSRQEVGAIFLLHTLHRQMLPDHIGIQLGALALSHHGSFGHHDVLLRQPGGKMQPLLD